MQSSPSGIAQLRKSSEHNMPQPDPMNLDDFIFSDNSASPGNFASPQGDKMADDRVSNPMASAIPIKSRKELSHQTFVPQSVPVQPLHQATQGHEFNYVNRHLRKTSIDDRRVSDSNNPSILFFAWPAAPFFPRHRKLSILPTVRFTCDSTLILCAYTNFCNRLGSAPLISHHKFRLSTLLRRMILILIRSFMTTLWINPTRQAFPSSQTASPSPLVLTLSWKTTPPWLTTMEISNRTSHFLPLLHL